MTDAILRALVVLDHALIRIEKSEAELHPQVFNAAMLGSVRTYIKAAVGILNGPLPAEPEVTEGDTAEVVPTDIADAAGRIS